MVLSVVALLTALALLAPSAAPSDPPSVTVTVAPAIFSPNRDGRRDSIAITVVPDRPVDLTLRIERRSDGKIVRTLATGVAIDSADTVRWRGLNDAMRHAADGGYLAVASVLDPVSGDAAKASVRIAIDTVAPGLSRLRVAPEPWRGTGGVHLAFTLADAGAGTSFTVGFTIRDATGRDVRRVAGLERHRGRGTVTWDTRNRTGGHVPNGGYTFTLRATDEAGNMRESPGQPFRLARPVSASIVSTVTGAGRRVALTFDDCGNDRAWQQILTTLHDANAGGTFFCVGTSVTRRPALARRTASLGMTVGNHTWSHVDLRAVSRDQIASQLERDGAAWWQEAHATPLPYLRPTYGSYDRRVLNVAGSLGYRWVVLWDVDPRDWSGISASAIARAVLAHTHGGSIVVLHLRTTTAAALPAILRGLAARHLSAVTLTTLLRSGTPSAGFWPPSVSACRADAPRGGCANDRPFIGS